jgi:hypothetical protein
MRKTRVKIKEIIEPSSSAEDFGKPFGRELRAKRLSRVAGGFFIRGGATGDFRREQRRFFFASCCVASSSPCAT